MRQWTDQEKGKLLRLVAEWGPDWDRIASEGFGNQRTPEACRKRYGHLTKEDEEPPEEDHALPRQRILYDPEKSAGWRERIEAAVKIKEIRDRDTPFVPIADVEIKARGPIGILITSDWQLGSLGVDYATWQEHINQFLGFDRMYMVVNGDLISNTHIHKTLSAVWSQVMSPEEQALLVGGIAREMVDKGKILAITLSEEHDQKDARDTGRAGILDMLRDKKVPLFDNRGILVVRLGMMIYVLYCVHRSRFYSSFNQLHSGYREFSLGLPANIIVTSHKHRPAWGTFPWYPELKMLTEHLELPLQLGGEVLVVQTGTYETDSKFGNEFFGMGVKPKLQIVVLYPDRFRVVPVDSFEDARRVMSE